MFDKLLTELYLKIIVRNVHTVFALIEARSAIAGISSSETVLISGETIIVIETPLAPYILQVFIVIWLIEASLYKIQHI